MRDHFSGLEKYLSALVIRLSGCEQGYGEELFDDPFVEDNQEEEALSGSHRRKPEVQIEPAPIFLNL